MQNDKSTEYYEAGFFAKFKYWVRTHDPVTGESRITDDCPQLWEYYVPHPQGDFSSIYDDTKYLCRHGSSQDSKGHGCVCQVSPLDLANREMKGLNNPNPRIMYLDIETRVGTVRPGFPSPDKALEPVSLIQFLDSKTQVVHIIGDREFYYSDWYLSQEDHLNHTVVYHKCKSEDEMFDVFFNFIEDMKPVIVYAWNGEGFDFGYLYNRCKRIGQDVSRFSPFWRKFGAHTGEQYGYISTRVNDFQGQYQFSLQAGGIYYMDIKHLYKKIILKPRPSYALNAIAQTELKSRKIEHLEFQTFDDFYLGNYTMPENPSDDQKNTLCYKMSIEGCPEEEIRKAGHGMFVYYGVIDVVLLKEIDKKCGLTDLMCQISNTMQSQYVTILGTTKPWSNNIRNVLYDKKLIAPIDSILARGADMEKSILGGFVRDPISGKHNWVVSEDINSMYPLLAIAGSNMSPETFMFAWELKDEGFEGELKEFTRTVLKVGTDQEQNEHNLLNAIKDPEVKDRLSFLLTQTNLTLAPNGVFFKRSIEGVLPGLVVEIYNKRKVVKKSMFKKEQQLVNLQTHLRHRRANSGTTQ